MFDESVMEVDLILGERLDCLDVLRTEHRSQRTPSRNKGTSSIVTELPECFAHQQSKFGVGKTNIPE